MRLCQYLVAARELSGLSRADLAQAVGVTRQAIEHWEEGRRVPQAHLLVELGRIYDWTDTQLVEALRLGMQKGDDR